MNLRTKKNYILLFLFCLFFASTNLFATSNFHVILATDLNADEIEDGVEKDLERIQKEVSKIAKYTHMEMEEKLFIGKRSDPEKMIAYLQDLDVEPDDVILFYFSGHGFRTKTTQDSPWPTLSFEKADVGIHFKDIANILETKNARLTLLFADCCNNKMSLSRAPRLIRVKDRLYQEIKNKQMKIGYCKLFLEARGFLMISSAEATEHSYTDDDEGSMFTIALTKGLREVSKNPVNEICWSSLIASTEKHLSKMTTESEVVQHPVIYNMIVD